MVIHSAFSSVFAAALTGLALSVMIESLMTPRPSLARPWVSWALHGGLWLSAHAVMTLLLGRPWFAAAAVSAFLLMVVLVNNAKFKALREPFVYQDYEYFTDAIRHPRLYIPFLGWWKFLGAATGFVLAVSLGLWGEATPEHRLAINGQLGGILVTFAGSVLLLWLGNKQRLAIRFAPDYDNRTFGLLASFWHYYQAEKLPWSAKSPFASLDSNTTQNPLPHLVAVQSESFFDARALYGGIRPEVLSEFDRLKQDAVAHGKLTVPAWGANTVRTEFAFLSGIPADQLGVHRFNPYRAIAAGHPVSSVASHLKRLGYRTICIHPYPASFYQRDRVYPRLDFDEFIDIEEFDDSMRSGPYISDAAVADKVAALLQDATVPLFIFAITMENHGPLHLEHVSPGDIDALYNVPPPAGCDDLTIYLRHLRNANSMIAKLRKTLETCPSPASLCWYGDHVPIMPEVYSTFGEPDGEVEYGIWNNHITTDTETTREIVDNLSLTWIEKFTTKRGETP